MFLAIIAEQIKSADGDLDRYRGNFVLKVRGPKGESEFKGKLKGCGCRLKLRSNTIFEEASFGCSR